MEIVISVHDRCMNAIPINGENTRELINIIYGVCIIVMSLCHVLVSCNCAIFVWYIYLCDSVPWEASGRAGRWIASASPSTVNKVPVIVNRVNKVNKCVNFVCLLPVCIYHVFPASRYEWFLDSDILTAFDITLWTMSLSWECFVVITDITAQRFLTRYHIWPPPSSWPVDVKWFERLVLLKTWGLIECSRNLIA